MKYKTQAVHAMGLYSPTSLGGRKKAVSGRS